MENIRRAVVPVIVIIIIVAALIYRLSSCAPGGTNNDPAAVSSVSPSASPSESPGTSASPTPPYADKEIERIYADLGLSIVEIRNAGAVTMVHYYKPTGVTGEVISRFDWFDRKTGSRELAFGWAYTDKFEIKLDKSLTVLTTGESYIDGSFSFPQVFRANWINTDGAVEITRGMDKYYAPLGQSYTVGIERPESLTDINFNAGFLSLGFGVQPGYEAGFYAASESIPKMSIKNEDGYSVITLYKTILSEEFKKPAIQENTYCSLVSVISDGTNTVIQLKLNETATRYNVSQMRSPATDMPYAVIEFTNTGYNYPAGW